MTATLSQLQLSETSLFQNSFTQRSADNSFDQKLRSELERWGLFFSPGNQLFNLSAYPSISLFSDVPKTQISFEPHLLNQDNPENLPQSTSHKSRVTSRESLAISYESPVTTQLFNQQIQNLLQQTGWLAPNLEAQLPFYQAFLEGKLLTKLDLKFLVDQILEQVKLVKGKGKVELTLGLKPEELGEILLVLTSRSGMISIEIRASEESKKLIEAEIEELKAALKKAKVELNEIIVREVEKNA